MVQGRVPLCHNNDDSDGFNDSGNGFGEDDKGHDNKTDDSDDADVYVVAAGVAVLAKVSDRLVGLVVKASASTAEVPGFKSRWRRDFFGVESYR